MKGTSESGSASSEFGDYENEIHVIEQTSSKDSFGDFKPFNRTIFEREFALQYTSSGQDMAIAESNARQDIEILKRENFNLKLRLYLLEEQICGYQPTTSSSETSLLSALAETEMLRNEIKKKTDALNNAVEALERMKNVKIMNDRNRKTEVDALRRRVAYLENEQYESNSHELENTIMSLREKLLNLREINHQYELKIDYLSLENITLKDKLENKEKELDFTTQCQRALQEAYNDLKNANNKSNHSLILATENLNSCEQQMRDQYKTISKKQSIISKKTASSESLIKQVKELENKVIQNSKSDKVSIANIAKKTDNNEKAPGDYDQHHRKPKTKTKCIDRCSSSKCLKPDTTRSIDCEKTKFISKIPVRNAISDGKLLSDLAIKANKSRKHARVHFETDPKKHLQKKQ